MTASIWQQIYISDGLPANRLTESYTHSISNASSHIHIQTNSSPIATQIHVVKHEMFIVNKSAPAVD